MDIYQNPEFDDPNANHIGIDLTNMNSTGGSFIPAVTLTTTHSNLYLQMWIDYVQADSYIDIYITEYGQDKPPEPSFTSKGLDLSILNEYMYVGFSAAVERLENNDVPKILAWSFSTDGPAPEISLATDAPPSSSPPPQAPQAPPPPPPGAPPLSTSSSSNIPSLDRL